MEFSRPECRSGQPFPPPGDLPNPGMEPRLPALPVDSLPAEPPGKPLSLKCCIKWSLNYMKERLHTVFPRELDVMQLLWVGDREPPRVWKVGKETDSQPQWYSRGERGISFLWSPGWGALSDITESKSGFTQWTDWPSKESLRKRYLVRVLAWSRGTP